MTIEIKYNPQEDRKNIFLLYVCKTLLKYKIIIFCLLPLLTSCATRTVSFYSKTYEKSENILDMQIQDIFVDANEVRKERPDFYEDKTIKEIFKEAFEARVGKSINSLNILLKHFLI